MIKKDVQKTSSLVELVFGVNFRNNEIGISYGSAKLETDIKLDVDVIPSHDPNNLAYTDANSEDYPGPGLLDRTLKIRNDYELTNYLIDYRGIFALSDTTSLIPVVSYGKTNKDIESPNAEIEIDETSFKIGCAAQYQTEKSLFFTGLTLATNNTDYSASRDYYYYEVNGKEMIYNEEDTQIYIDSNDIEQKRYSVDLDEEKDVKNTTFKLNMGFERKLSKHFIGRVGVQSTLYNNQDSNHEVKIKTTDENGNVKTKRGELDQNDTKSVDEISDDDFLSIGLGYKKNNFAVDLTVKDSIPYNGGYLFSGEKGALIGKISATILFP